MDCSTESAADDKEQRKEGMERRRVEWKRKSRKMLKKDKGYEGRM